MDFGQRALQMDEDRNEEFEEGNEEFEEDRDEDEERVVRELHTS